MYREPSDVHEAALALIEARGSRCAACDDSLPLLHLHRADPPCEERAWQVLRQRVAEARAIPGESEASAQWRIVRNLFNDVARSAEAQDPRGRPVRFIDLDDEVQRLCVTGIRGLLMQWTQVAHRYAGRR